MLKQAAAHFGRTRQGETGRQEEAGPLTCFGEDTRHMELGRTHLEVAHICREDTLGGDRIGHTLRVRHTWMISWFQNPDCAGLSCR